MSFSLGYYPFPKKPLFCRACVPSPTKGGGDGRRSLAAMGRGGRRREREKTQNHHHHGGPKKNPASSPFSSHPEWRRASFFCFPFSLFLFVRRGGGFVFVSRSNPRESRSREGGKGKSAYLLGLAPKAMSESCGIFFFRRRHFSFAVKEEERKIPSPPSFHLPPPPPQLLIRVPRWFAALEEAAADTRGQWSIPIPLYTAYGPSLVHYFPTK